MTDYNTEYNNFYNNFKNSNLDNDLRYDKDKLDVILETLKKIKNKICEDDENIKTLVNNKISEIDNMKGTLRSSTDRTFKVFNDTIPTSDVKGYASTIESKIQSFIESLEFEKQVMDDYITQSETKQNYDKYKKYLADYADVVNSQYVCGPPVQIDTGNSTKVNISKYTPEQLAQITETYNTYKKLIEDYDNNVYLNRLSSSKLVKKAVDSKVLFKNSQTRTTASTARVTPAAVSVTPIDKTTFEPKTPDIDKNTTPTPELDNKVVEPTPIDPSTDTDKKEEFVSNTDKADNVSNIIKDFTPSSSNNGGTSTQVKTNSISSAVSALTSGATKGKEAATSATTSLKDIISKSIESKKNGSLLSSVKKGTTGLLSPIKKPTNNNQVKVPTSSQSTNGAAKFVPPIAGIATASTAGFGAKIYMDNMGPSKKKDDDKKKKQQRKDTKFFDYNNIDKEDNDIDSIKTLSKKELETAISKQDKPKNRGGFADNDLPDNYFNNN